MNTQVMPINEKSLALAKDILFSEGVVAFPTETVYGLGADARSDKAVSEVFKIKGRPSDNPLIVHVHKDYDLSTLIKNEKSYVKELKKAFLPGPLTLVYESKGCVSKFVSCGLNTLAIRVPSHEGAQEFLRKVNIPIAAPSANISKHVSPVSAEHVFNDLNGSLPLILDGGQCFGGIESTVCDVTGDIPVILRSGLVSREMIESVVGRCDIYNFKQGEIARSPGMKYKHYSPKCKTKLYKSDEKELAKKEIISLRDAGTKVYVLCEDLISSEFSNEYVLNLGKNEFEMAANLYDLLRKGEEKAEIIIAIEPIKKDGVMEGVLNRLRKACAE